MELKTKLAALGLTVGLVGGGAAGVVLSSAGVSGASTVAAVQDDPTTTVAPAEDTTQEQGARHEARLQEALAPLVEDGTLTQEQADKVIEALEAARPAGGQGGDQGRGPGGGHGMGRGPGMEAAATALGLEPDALREQLRDGSTLAEVAEAQGVDPQAVIDAMVAEMKAHLDEEVAAGEHTQEEADAKLAEATSRITDMVNNGFQGGRGPGGGNPDAEGGN